MTEQFIALFVYSERQVEAYGPFDTYERAKRTARTLSADPEEALVVPLTSFTTYAERVALHSPETLVELLTDVT